MRLFTCIILTSLCLLLTGCQLGYLSQSAYYQIRLLQKRQPIADVQVTNQLSPEEQRKLLLAQKAKKFAVSELHLAQNGNYESLVLLDQPFVSYVLQAAPKNSLQHHLWSFPIVGKVPYKGYYRQKDAEEEEAKFIQNNFDTYVRGVSAYSTLGWFDDPILSSMLRYEDHDLVEVIIHETVHATLYIKSHADFNERLATFIGQLGTKSFYETYEGHSSKTLQLIEDEQKDDRLFSRFISEEIKLLSQWYEANSTVTEPARLQRLQQINQRFASEVMPQLKTKKLHYFAQLPLNNAKLLVYKTYQMDLQLFTDVYAYFNQDLKAFLDYCKTLQASSDPEQDLKNLLQQ